MKTEKSRFLIGNRIYLRGLEEDEFRPGTVYYDWLDDLSIDTHTERSYFPNSYGRMVEFYKRISSQNDILHLGIFSNNSHRHIGNIELSNINYMHRRAEISYLIGDKSIWRQGIATDAVLMLMYYGFNKLNIERISAGASEFNQASLRVLEKAGFEHEGRLRRHIVRNGGNVDVIILGALRESWMQTHGPGARSCFEQSPT